jgi:uncharacterized protein DUF5615
VACGPGSDLWLKLLLNEHLSPEIARQLRERGHDVIAVGERADLRGRSDRVHFASLPAEQRAIVTRDLAELRRGGKTSGLVCVPGRFPFDRDGIGRLVRALDSLLLANPGVDAAIALGGEIWLEDVAQS